MHGLTMLIMWIPILLLLLQLCNSMEINEEMYFHLHVRVRGGEEITGVYNSVSQYAIELTNTVSLTVIF